MELAVLREDMVDGLEAAPKNVLTDETVSVAMRDVSRHAFLDDERTAYADREHEALGTRVLAPSTAARLLQALALEGDETVLIVGVGVGYTAAVAAEIVGETNVHAIDISRPLVAEARRNLAAAGYDGVLVDCRDGANGLPEYAPFDRILLEAAVVDPPRALREQLDPITLEPLLVEGEQSGAVERNRMTREDRERAQRRAESRRGWEQDWIEWDETLGTQSRQPRTR